MLILPFFRKIDWHSPPVITLLIILINVFVYFVMQSGDEEAFDEAVNYYLESSLPDIEYPLYAAYLQQSDQREKHDELFETKSNSRKKHKPNPNIYFALEHDMPFQNKLEADEIVTPANKDYATWKSERDHYTELTDDIVTDHYSFTPAKPTTVGLFTHMFLHGSPMHLIGNMVVLFIVGYSVEIILGWRMYIFAYILGGLAAVGFFWMINPDSAGLVGASGAISGVMGIYAALFGLRKINFFYFVFIYMGFFTAPALLILVVWLLNELIQYMAEPKSQVAYMAHFGGLLGGAVIGFANRHLHKNMNTDYIEKPQQEAQLVADMDRGVELMRSMKFEPAKRIFKQLLKTHPNNLDILPHMYTVSKTAPDSEDYHQTALAILQICIDTNQGLSLANQVFNEYTRQAKPAPRLNIAMCLKLGSRFCKAGFMDTAEKIVQILMPKAAKLPELAPLLAQMGNAYNQQNNLMKSKQFYQALIKSFPNSVEAMHVLKAKKI